MPGQISLKDPSQYRLIGRERLPRLDSHAKSTGSQQFAIDVQLPDMMIAMLLRPPRFGAQLKSIDASRAKAVAGVVDVVQVPRGLKMTLPAAAIAPQTIITSAPGSTRTAS